MSYELFWKDKLRGKNSNKQLQFFKGRREKKSAIQGRHNRLKVKGANLLILTNLSVSLLKFSKLIGAIETFLKNRGVQLSTPLTLAPAIQGQVKLSLQFFKHFNQITR